MKENMGSRLIEHPWFIASAATITTAFLILGSGFRPTFKSRDLCVPFFPADGDDTPLDAIVHYATSQVVPQQTKVEIGVTLAVLRRRAPCNFLVFGLGHDSVMWAGLNHRGRTLFLEEDKGWVDSVLKDAGPNTTLRAHAVQYRTHLADAQWLLKYYKNDTACDGFHLNGSTCQLALSNLPDEVYDHEWDLIMIDAPRGYSSQLPGRMAAIYSAAVMARRRRSPGDTDVFLHDVDRKVEKTYAMEFLCQKYLTGKAGKLWHFTIPPAIDAGVLNRSRFC